MDRRDFLKSNILGAAGLALAASPLSAVAAPAKKGGRKTELKLSFQEKIAPGESLNEKLDYMENLGIVGFEPNGRNLAARVNELEQALRVNSSSLNVLQLQHAPRINPGKLNGKYCRCPISPQSVVKIPNPLFSLADSALF